MSEPIVIRCRDNGPFVIKAPVQVVDHDGKPFTIPAGKETIALCRCGASKNKPFLRWCAQRLWISSSRKSPCIRDHLALALPISKSRPATSASTLRLLDTIPEPFFSLAMKPALPVTV